MSKPDEKCVLTYIATYYHTFAKMKTGVTEGKRINNIVMKIKGSGCTSRRRLSQNG